MEFFLDTLGGINYRKTILSMPKTTRFGLFHKVQGWKDGYPLVEELINRGFPTPRVQLIWRDDHQFGNEEVALAKKEIVKFQKLAIRYNGIIDISPFCEHELKDPDIILNEVCSVLRSPYYINVINCPSPNIGALSKNFNNEIHGEEKRIPKGWYIYSYDGTDMTRSNISEKKKRHKNAGMFGAWIPQNNGKINDKQGEEADKTPRPLRKAYPNKGLLLSQLEYANEKGVTRLPKDTLFKSHAEQKKNVPLLAEPRALKPVIITPIKASYLKLVDSRGVVVAKSGSPLPYEGGRWRYYFASYGYTYKKTENLFIFTSDNIKIGLVNPGWRENDYK